jgi:hypothetical protein
VVWVREGAAAAITIAMGTDAHNSSRAGLGRSRLAAAPGIGVDDFLNATTEYPMAKNTLAAAPTHIHTQSGVAGCVVLKLSADNADVDASARTTNLMCRCMFYYERS